MSNSPLVDTEAKLSPNKNKRINATYNPTGEITVITPHMMAGNCDVVTLGEIFAQKSRQASSNYGIGTDGSVAMYVPEDCRSWCSSSRVNDYKAVTIEVANDTNKEPWTISDKAWKKLVALCADICQRNNIPRLIYTGDSTGNLTMHKWFANTSCPGTYLAGKFAELAEEVNLLLAGDLKDGDTVELSGVPGYDSAWGKQTSTRTGTFYVWNAKTYNGKVRITNDPYNVGRKGTVLCWITERAAKLNKTFSPYSAKMNTRNVKIYAEPSEDAKTVGTITDGGIYTIVAEENGFGRLKSGAGWLRLTDITKMA